MGMKLYGIDDECGSLESIGLDGLYLKHINYTFLLLLYAVEICVI